MIYTHAAVAIAALALGFAGGWSADDWRHGANELERVRAEHAALAERADRGDQAAVKHEEFKAKQETRYVTRTKLVDRILERPVYLESCLDPDGLQLLNAEIAGRAAPGEPAPGVPAAAGAGR
jgi:hypothetical protein